MPPLAGILQQSGFSGFSMVAGTGFDPPPPRARTVAALRCFFRFYVESDYLERDPSARAAHAEEARGAARRVLDRAELSRLLDVPGREGIGSACTPARWSAIVCCWRCSPMEGYAAQSRSASISMTCISTGCAQRGRAGTSVSCRAAVLCLARCASAEQRAGAVPGRPRPAKTRVVGASSLAALVGRAV